MTVATVSLVEADAVLNHGPIIIIHSEKQQGSACPDFRGGLGASFCPVVGLCTRLASPEEPLAWLPWLSGGEHEIIEAHGGPRRAVGRKIHRGDGGSLGGLAILVTSGVDRTLVQPRFREQQVSHPLINRVSRLQHSDGDRPGLPDAEDPILRLHVVRRGPGLIHKDRVTGSGERDSHAPGLDGRGNPAELSGLESLFYRGLLLGGFVARDATPTFTSSDGVNDRAMRAEHDQRLPAFLVLFYDCLNRRQLCKST